MILIGQYDSSFVRRVAIALRLYGIAFEHRPWSVFGDADRLQALNPLIRVPTLVLDNGDVLIESHAIIDYIDALAPDGRTLFPAKEPARHQAMKIASMATGLADKAVSLFYVERLHDNPSKVFVDRWRSQIQAALAALEAECALKPDEYFFGNRPGHADIAVACALRHVSESLPALVSLAHYPALMAHCGKLEALPVFQEIQQPFIAPT